MKTNKPCAKCDGKGYYFVMNGEDDIEPISCECPEGQKIALYQPSSAAMIAIEVQMEVIKNSL